jgi:hypothetical protein
MYTISDLNFVLIVYQNNARVARIPCNFLMEPHIESGILSHFICANEDSSNFYTSFEIEYQGSIIDRKDFNTYLKNMQSIY